VVRDAAREVHASVFTVIKGKEKRKGVRFPSCRATVMETKAEHATVQQFWMGRPASRMSSARRPLNPKTSMEGEKIK
jgi:hypothetical protein